MAATIVGFVMFIALLWFSQDPRDRRRARKYRGRIERPGHR